VIAGHFVLQSDPANIYGNLERGTHRRPDEVVAWSSLLGSETFRARVREAAGAPAAEA
jgi:hypothetical protein